jgi:predicted metal-dependent phosphoesterase TrpH
MTPVELVQRAKRIGLHGVCITEHNQIWGREQIHKLSETHDILVLGGVEVATDCGEILVFGIHRSVRNIVRTDELRGMVEEVGGVMIAAHPFRGELGLFKAPPSIEEASARSLFQFVDALEVQNGLSGDKEMEFAASVASHLSLPEVGGSDAHAILGVGRCFTIFERAVSSESELVEEIRAGRCRGAVWDDALLNR